MPFTLTKSNDRKLVAVIGIGDSCLYVRATPGSMCIDDCGAQVYHNETLEQLLERDGNRTPVYSGEEVTIKFR